MVRAGALGRLALGEGVAVRVAGVRAPEARRDDGALVRRLGVVSRALGVVGVVKRGKGTRRGSASGILGSLLGGRLPLCSLPGAGKRMTGEFELRSGWLGWPADGALGCVVRGAGVDEARDGCVGAT